MFHAILNPKVKYIKGKFSESLLLNYLVFDLDSISHIGFTNLPSLGICGTDVILHQLFIIYCTLREFIPVGYRYCCLIPLVILLVCSMLSHQCGTTTEILHYVQAQRSAYQLGQSNDTLIKF